MIYSIMEKMGSCINDSQWKIGAFLTNSYANPKKFRSRKKKIHFGLNQQSDCVVIPNPDRKSSVILEANRSQIPIASLVDSTIPWESYKRITYPIPANDTIQFIYLFLNSITKTVISASHSSLRKKRSATGSRIILFQQRRYMHSSELFLAVAPFLPEIADQIIDATDLVDTTNDQVHTTNDLVHTTNDQVDTTKNQIREEDLNQKLRNVQRKRLERIAEEEFQTFIKDMDPEDFPFELKRKEYELFLDNRVFYRECLRILGEKFPMLDEAHARQANIPQEEYRLRNLVEYLLKRQKKRYTLKNVFLLERDMRNPDWLKSVIFPLIAEFNRGGWRK